MNDSSLPQGTRPTLALSVTGLTKHYDSGFTLYDVTFDLPSGYIMGLVGPNGAGKSTLIKLILNMDHARRRDESKCSALTRWPMRSGSKSSWA